MSSLINFAIKGRSNSPNCDFVVHTYSFRGKPSPNDKQGLHYIVRVEEYKYFFHVIKFYPKKFSASSKKYQLLTQENDMGRILATCLAIMKDIFRKNPYVSFGFIGSNNENEATANTQRYRIYKRIMENLFSPVTFQHFFYEEKSAYILLNRNNNETQLLEKITLILEKIYHLGLRKST